MNKRKQTFNQLLNNLPPLKNINSEDRLPGYFDMMWDIKYGYQLFDYLKMHNNPDVYSALAKHGYDAKKLKNQYDQRRN